MLMILQNVLPLFGGFIGGIFKMHLENKAEQQKMLIAGSKLEEKSRRRAGNIKDEKVAWTRRTIALIFTIGLLVIIAIVLVVGAMAPEININVPQVKYKHSLLSLVGITSPKEVQDYVQLTGVTIVMELIAPIISALQVIVGFYFGSAKNK